MKSTFFKNKEEYLQCRKEWKEKYKLLSQTIKDKKWMRDCRNRAWSKSWIEIGIGKEKTSTFLPRWDMVKNILSHNIRYVELQTKYKNNMLWLEWDRKNAKDMMEELKLDKQEAQRQYLASKNPLDIPVEECIV